MNIFVLDECPKLSAQYMCDKHVVKMCTETMQMMSTIADHLGFDSPYRPVMLNHPCTIWARESKQNFQWLREHLRSLLSEYSRRYYQRIHKVESTHIEYNEVFNKVEDTLPDIGLTPFAVAISDEQKCRKEPNFKDASVVDKYRMYYSFDKRYFASWKKGAPSWWVY